MVSFEAMARFVLKGGQNLQIVLVIRIGYYGKSCVYRPS